MGMALNLAPHTTGFSAAPSTSSAYSAPGIAGTTLANNYLIYSTKDYEIFVSRASTESLMIFQNIAKAEK